VSEFAIGTEALGRKPDFDPKTDATVRVHVSRLRQKVKEFYDGEGKNCPVRISIPLGQHELNVQVLQQVAPPEAAIRAKPNKLPTVLLNLTGICAVLAITCIVEYVQNRKLTFSGRQTVPLPRFWQSFFANGKPTDLFLPTPVFFEWNGTNLKLRDPRVNDFADFGNFEELNFYTKQMGNS